jgi:hypothetical protein
MIVRVKDYYYILLEERNKFLAKIVSHKKIINLEKYIIKIKLEK